MAVPDNILNQAFDKDKEGEHIFITCPECTKYERTVEVKEFDSPKKAFDQAKRQFGSHYSQVHQNGGGGSSKSETSNKGSQDQRSNPPSEQPQQNPEGQGQQQSGLDERELIYQRGRDGLREIKKQRLKNWLDNTEGVGPQTKSRVLMVFDRNESVHTNPHVLFNLLDDELSASPSYLNTMVEDIFEPEREHEDILSNQGYTPWYRRNNMSNQRGGGRQRGGGMGYSQGGGGAQGFRGGSGNRQQRGRQPQRGGGGGNSISRDEAEHLVERSLQKAEEQGNRNALVSGLSEATDEAVREMASNVGGLAGTFQRVVDEALVEYARKNPEWVIENMGMLQKILGAVEEPEEGEEQPQKPRQDEVVDEAVSSIESSQNESTPPPVRREGSSSDSGFQPSQETRNKMKEAAPEQEKDKDDQSQDIPDKTGPPEPKPEPGSNLEGEFKQENENEESKREKGESDESDENEEEDSIFGDMYE